MFAASLAVLDLVYDGMFLSKFAAMDDQRPFFAQVVIMIGSGLGMLDKQQDTDMLIYVTFLENVSNSSVLSLEGAHGARHSFLLCADEMFSPLQGS